MELYRIKNIKTGLFSKGGMDCDKDNTTYRWSKKGKIWTGIGPLKSHLRQYVNDNEYSKKYKNNIPEEWIVVKPSNGDWVEHCKARSLYPETKYQTP
jgi:hypothetical protein